MKALTYQGTKKVRVETVPDPELVAPDDILLRVTATAICGSDLHLYRGKVPGLKDGDILGHEFMGIVEEVGPEVTQLNRGDRVVVPFTISCGGCFFCEKKLFSACETTNPDRGAILNKKDIHSGAGMFGYTHLYGGYAGGQAEFVRVPKANIGPFKLPSNGLADADVLFLGHPPDRVPSRIECRDSARLHRGHIRSWTRRPYVSRLRSLVGRRKDLHGRPSRLSA